MIYMFASGQTFSNGAAGFLFVNMIVKKERHGSCSRDTSHTLQRRLLTLHKPTEQKLIDNKTIFLKDYLDTGLLGMTEGNA